MIDISELSWQEINDLEEQIKRYKDLEKHLCGYKVTFYVRFNPGLHRSDSLTYLGELDPDVFGEWLVNNIPDRIIDSLNMENPEDVSGFTVELAKKEDLDQIWGKE